MMIFKGFGLWKPKVKWVFCANCPVIPKPEYFGAFWGDSLPLQSPHHHFGRNSSQAVVFLVAIRWNLPFEVSSCFQDVFFSAPKITSDVWISPSDGHWLHPSKTKMTDDRWKIPIVNRKYILKWLIFHCHVSHEKNPLTFHYTAWLIGILLMVYYNTYITG